MVHAHSEVGSDRTALARGLYAHLMVALAGVAAQRFAGYPENEDRLAGGDIDNTIVCSYRLARIEAGLPMQPGPDEDTPRAIGRFRTASDTIILRAVRETIDLLKKNWSAVERVAGVLAKHDRLSQAELDHVIATANVDGGDDP
jgi:hypothetical protein